MSIKTNTWVEISLSAIAKNTQQFMSLLSPATRLMAVVKANGYGHGAVEVANVALQNGATYLSVARLEEALQLRNAGINASILVLDPLIPCTIPIFIEKDLTATIASIEGCQSLISHLPSKDSRLKIHIKIDTGMGRLGLNVSDPKTIICIEQLFSSKALWIEGIYSHFACADEEDLTFTKEQFQRFLDLLLTLQTNGITFQIRHVANSAATIRLPESHLDMVRIGISLYGYPPSDAVDCKHLHLIPAMAVKSHVTHVKKVPAGFPVSYNSTYVTPASTTLATIPIGYADGFHRDLSNIGFILHQGKKYPIAGRVCMDQLVIDVKENSSIRAGDEVTIMGQDGAEKITAIDIARLINTISYEILCNFVTRAPRIYMK